MSHSKAILTLDQFYYKVEQILPDLQDTCRIIIARIQDESAPGLKKALFPLTKTARAVQKLPKTGHHFRTISERRPPLQKVTASRRRRVR
ncbi:MAG: hypothetical protein ACLU9S_22655 [Oscillospiraceae bacterium]